MHPVRKRRLLIVLLIVFAASTAAALLFFALSENMNYFYSPMQVKAGEAPREKLIRVGGLVLPGSVERSESSLDVRFVVTDNKEDVVVTYTGILPDLFSEGQGVIAAGTLDDNGALKASQVLAKHDENYMPPEVHDALKQGGGLPESMKK
jgi:cytochrome c-type biogenesis protein CcmE